MALYYFGTLMAEGLGLSNLEKVLSNFRNVDDSDLDDFEQSSSTITHPSAKNKR